MDVDYHNVEEIVVEKPILLSNTNVWITHIFIRFRTPKEIDGNTDSLLMESKITLHSENKKNLKIVKE